MVAIVIVVVPKYLSLKIKLINQARLEHSQELTNCTTFLKALLKTWSLCHGLCLNLVLQDTMNPDWRFYEVNLNCMDYYSYSFWMLLANTMLKQKQSIAKNSLKSF